MAFSVTGTQSLEKKYGLDSSKSSFEFRGWYADEACTKKYDFNSPDSDNIIYVKWTEQITDFEPAKTRREERSGRYAAVAAGAAAAATAFAALLLKRR